MSEATRAAEASRATIAMQVALAHLGATTIEQAILLWLRNDPTPAQVEAWLDQTMELIFNQRAISRELALAYFRLVRALHTGRTVPRPGEPVRTSVTLDELRAEFRNLAEAVVPDDLSEEAQQHRDAQEDREYDWTNDGENLDIPIDSDASDVLAEDPSGDDEADDRTEEILVTVGPSYRDRKLQEIDPARQAREVDQERAAISSIAAAQVAATVAYAAKDGARRAVEQAVELDRAVQAWLRITGADPCAFCAMLASRGPVYKSAQNAGANLEAGVEYHPNCNCTIVPAFTVQDWRADPAHASAVEAEALWDEYKKSSFYAQTKNYDNAMLNGWRRFLAARKRATRSRGEETAQEASAA